MNAMSPLRIHIMIHHYAFAFDQFLPGPATEWPKAQRDSFRALVHHGFLMDLTAPPYYRITEKGALFVERLKVAAYQIAKRINDGVPVSPPPLTSLGEELIRTFEGIPGARVQPATPEPAAVPPWMRGVRMTFKPVPSEPFDFGSSPMRYMTEVRISREKAEEMFKDFFASSGLGEPWRPHLRRGLYVDPTKGDMYQDTKPKPAWVTPAWEDRFDTWKRLFTARGMRGAMHRRLMDMLFAKTDKLRDDTMLSVVSARVVNARTYGELRRAILDAERPK